VGETVGWAGPKAGGQQQVPGFSGGTDFAGEPIQRRESLGVADEFPQRVVIETAGEGEEGKKRRLQRLKGSFLVGGVGSGFQFAGERGGKGGGIEQVRGQQGDRLERLSAGLPGGEEWWERSEIECLEDRLDAGRGIYLEALSQAESNGFAEKQGEDGRGSADIFFKRQAGGGEDLFEPGVASAEPGEIPPGGEDRVG
jgi:hypothetical protein